MGLYFTATLSFARARSRSIKHEQAHAPPQGGDGGGLYLTATFLPFTMYVGNK